MASEQRVPRKKQARNISSEERCHPVLYRHQDCIPNQRILQSCEKLNPLCFNSNLDVEYQGKLVNQQSANIQKTKAKQLDSKIKNDSKPDKNKQECKINLTQPNGAVGNNEEVSKARRRRLRKRRLLISLGPSLNRAKPAPVVEIDSPPIPVARSVVRPVTSALPSTSSSPNNKSSEANKPSIKEARKRLDKSVGSRIKTLKNKILSDNQAKADIIKCLEEKKRSSLLQTLNNLNNSSPKKEKTSNSLVSFPEKRLNPLETNLEKDGVFYFGETKNQLENLTSFNIHSAQENPATKPIVQVNQKCSPKQTGNFNESSSGFRFVLKSPEVNNTLVNSLPKPSTEVKRNVFNFESISLVNPTEGTKIFPTKPSPPQTRDHEFKAPLLKDLSKFAIQQVLNLNKEVAEPSPHTSSVSNTYDNNIVKTLNCSLKATSSSHSSSVSGGGVLKEDPALNKNNFSTDLHDTSSSTMKPLDVQNPNKTNKTREEILLEREAKKAAKIASKAKHKTSQAPKSHCQSNENSKLPISTVSNDQSNTLYQDKGSVLKEKPSEGTKPTSSESKLLKDIVDTLAKCDLKEDAITDSSAKTKAELRVERRVKQEAQRAAKASNKAVPTNPKENKIALVKNAQPKPEASKTVKFEKKVESSKTCVTPKHKLFSHLYQEKIQLSPDQKLKVGGLHSAIVRLGIQYSYKVVVGSNARCVALLHALKQVVNDYTTPLEKEFKRGLEEELGPITIYLNQCRPLAVSMTNALRHIKRTLTQLPNNIPDIEARRKVCDIIDTYITEQIDVAGKQICNTVKEKISDGDVILTYGCSSLVYKILVESHLSGIKFRVVVVDAFPWREGREMLRRLVDKGFSCTYVLITAASFIMREASKVLLGAHALLANGYVMSRAGSSQVALLAHCYNVPVLVCCETHKFCERVQTDAFVYNELGDLSYENVSVKDKDKSKGVSYLTPLSLAYDITPPDLISAVVTELAVLPCTSVPVILRIKPSESVM